MSEEEVILFNIRQARADGLITRAQEIDALVMVGLSRLEQELDTEGWMG